MNRWQEANALAWVRCWKNCGGIVRPKELSPYNVGVDEFGHRVLVPKSKSGKPGSGCHLDERYLRWAAVDTAMGELGFTRADRLLAKRFLVGVSLASARANASMSVKYTELPWSKFECLLATIVFDNLL